MTWRIERRAPHPGLRGLVSEYAEFAHATGAPSAQVEIASPDVALLLDFGPGWRIAQQADHGHFTSFVGGMHDGPTRVEHPGSAFGLQVNLTPLGARVLLGLPQVELAHRVVALDDLLGGAARGLVERVHDAGDVARRVALLDGVLLARAAAATPARPDVARAWARLTAARGALRVESLAAELGCSRRHLSATFRAELGLAPKAYARILRFRRAAALLERGEELARVAAACGYADQPHLNREFRALAGSTPVTFVQDRGRERDLASAP